LGREAEVGKQRKAFAGLQLEFIASASLWEIGETKEVRGRSWQVAGCQEPVSRSGIAINQIVKERVA